MAVPIVLALALAAGLSGCGGSGKDAVMPNVVGKKLDVALSDVDRAGVNKDDVEVVGGGVFGVVDKSNWVVCEQSPAAGSAVTGKPRFTVDRSCSDVTPAPPSSPAEPTDAASATPSDDATTAATAPVAATDQLLTVETSTDFAAVMKQQDYCGPEIASFAAKYAGAKLAFDGAIVAMASHDGTKTRYDILVNQGDFSETVAQPGPQFQFRDVNTTYDLHYSGDVPDSIGVGAKLHVVATVDQYIANQCLLLLKPVETSFR